jgi:hypothetical protein
MTPRPLHHAVRTALLLGILFHSVAIFAVWRTWGAFGRGNLLAWIDFPTSLAFLHLDGTPLLLWSLAAGGVQWALLAAALSFFLGRAARGQSR